MLIWCSTDWQQASNVLAANLRDMEISDFSSALIEDNGLQILDFINQSPTRVQAFIAFGEETAAENFCALLKETADSARM